MVIAKKTIAVRRVPADPPMDFFMSNNSPCSRFVKEVCFVRYIGIPCGHGEYISRIQRVDDYFLERANLNYYRLSALTKLSDSAEIARLAELYGKFERAQSVGINELLTPEMPYSLPDETLRWTQKVAFLRVMEQYRLNNSGATASMARNFGIKLLGWIARELPKLYGAANTMVFPKLLYIGELKQQEYLFLYYLHLLGCDVLYMNPKGDIAGLSEPLKSLSQLCLCEDLSPCDIMTADFEEYRQKTLAGRHMSASSAPMGPTDDVKRNEREKGQAEINAPPALNFKHPGRKGSQEQSLAPSLNFERPQRAGALQSANRELSYEELALRANSVVMLKVYDEHHKCFKTGSGIVISESGYILTNFHVANGATSFGVRFESEEQEHMTDELIKSHSFDDLALIRVNKRCAPVELYRGTSVVRGQKVVAIGSPLGLFNTVSDGIVSAFRTLDGVSMIQFTAPISPGSSGGALLDIYGRLIGVITGEFTEGQNLNLAVHYDSIYNFAGTFFSKITK